MDSLKNIGNLINVTDRFGYLYWPDGAVNAAVVGCTPTDLHTENPD